MTLINWFRQTMKIKRLSVGDLGTNCYLVRSGGEMAVIDPGGSAEEILKEIKKFQDGAKLRLIINTHYHFDHTLADDFLKKETGAEILIHQFEEKFINFKADRFLREGDEIKLGNRVLAVLHTPGHSAGSICLMSKKVIFTGDTLFKDGYGRTDLAGGSQRDIEDSLKRLSKLLKPGMTVLPGHGDIFKIL